MAKFVNVKTGNALVVNDPATIELMLKSDRYKTAEATAVAADAAVDAAPAAPAQKKK